MPKCTDCKYQGKYARQPVPFKPFGVSGASVSMIGIDIGEIQKLGFSSESDLVNYGMRCQAPGGGPTQLPIALMQAVVNQPCAHFAQKQPSQTVTQPENGSLEGAKPKWWQFWRKEGSVAKPEPECAPLQEGKRLSKEGKMKQAAACYGSAVVMGNLEAAEALRQLAEAEANYNKGNDMMKTNRLHEANTLYDMALKLYPEFADAWANKAIALFQMGDRSGAIAAFKKGSALGNKTAGENLRQILQQR